MALTGFRKSCTRIRGGIDHIAMIDAADIVDARYDPKSGSYPSISIRDGAGFAKFDFAEDQASYIEQVVGNTGQPIVKHTLKFTLKGMNAITRRAVEELARAKGGVVALVAGRQGEILLVGWSAKFGAQQALRIERAEGNTRLEPDETPAETISLSASDTEKAKPFTGEITWIG